MNRFAEYTTDELIALKSRAFDGHFGFLLECELADRALLRDAWLGHCNAVAGEVID